MALPGRMLMNRRAGDRKLTRNTPDLRSGTGRGHHGPAPVKGHGPHGYVFQLFALGRPVPGASPDPARPPEVIAAACRVPACGRLDGSCERTSR